MATIAHIAHDEDGHVVVYLTVEPSSSDFHVLLTAAQADTFARTLMEQAERVRAGARVTPEPLRQHAARHVRRVLDEHRGNKRQTCRVLGISYHTLNAHLRRADALGEGR